MTSDNSVTTVRCTHLGKRAWSVTVERTNSRAQTRKITCTVADVVVTHVGNARPRTAHYTK